MLLGGVLDELVKGGLSVVWVERGGTSSGGDRQPGVWTDESNLLEAIEFQGEQIFLVLEEDNSICCCIAEVCLMFRSVVGFFLPLFPIWVLIFTRFVNLQKCQYPSLFKIGLLGYLPTPIFCER